MANIGGIYGRGTVFAVHTDGTGFTNLHFFDGSEGTAPLGGLVFIQKHPVWVDTNDLSWRAC